MTKRFDSTDRTPPVSRQFLPESIGLSRECFLALGAPELFAVAFLAIPPLSAVGHAVFAVPVAIASALVVRA